MGVHSGHRPGVDWVWHALLLGVLLGSMGGGAPVPVQAQDAASPNVQDAASPNVMVEGNALHRSTRRLYYYRINSDSTIYVRQESVPSDSAIVIPAETFEMIYGRVQEQLLSPQNDELLNVGLKLEDKSLVLRFSQRFDLYVLGILIVVVVVGSSLLLGLWWRLSKERRRREALVRSRRYLTEGREKERERLAQEIHDGPVQDLHGLHMRLNALQDASDTSLVQEMGSELMRVTGELRALSADLHPPALQRFGLAAALRSHIDRLRERSSALQIDADLADACGPLPDDYALSVFRVAQEALNNAAQHGNASYVHVRLRCQDDTVELDVQDDGDGFPLPSNWHDLAKQDHYGLLGMRERAEAIGAELEIESAPGDGTRVRLHSSMGASSTTAAAEEGAPVPA